MNGDRSTLLWKFAMNVKKWSELTDEEKKQRRQSKFTGKVGSMLIRRAVEETQNDATDNSAPRGLLNLSREDIALPEGLSLAFCPTGEGGGIDNSCSSREGGGSSLSASHDSIRAEIATPPPPPKGTAYSPDVAHDGNGDGVADAARVGVPGLELPDKVPRLPNLTPTERAIEKDFAAAYEYDPQGLINEFYQQALVESIASGRAPIFETDAAKELYPAWRGDNRTKEQTLEFRSTMNTPLHQTANLIAKQAFLQHLDTLKPGDEIMVTNGGCGAGKGHALNPKNGVIPALEMVARAKVVWDSAGDQNGTENPWVQREAEARGLKVNYMFVSADAKERWADPEIGVVARAEKKGRMVDAEVFADSYIQGAKNFDAFFTANRGNTSANFTMIDADGKGATLKIVDRVPSAALKLKREELIAYSLQAVSQTTISARIQRGAKQGQRIWQKQ